jgi:hypothetical protein
MASAATTLLALLEHADGDQLEVLLEPANLLVVLGACGHDRERVKQQLGRGGTPGTLLLGVFERGKTADELIAMLPEAARQPPIRAAKERTSAPAGPIAPVPITAPAPGPEVTNALETRHAALVAWLAALTVPAMLASGVLPLWTIESSTAIALAAPLACLSGAFIAGRPGLRVAGAVGGLVSAPGAVWLAVLWMGLRDNPLRLELALAIAIGALPGLAIYGVTRLIMGIAAR